MLRYLGYSWLTLFVACGGGMSEPSDGGASRRDGTSPRLTPYEVSSSPDAGMREESGDQPEKPSTPPSVRREDEPRDPSPPPSSPDTKPTPPSKSAPPNEQCAQVPNLAQCDGRNLLTCTEGQLVTQACELGCEMNAGVGRCKLRSGGDCGRVTTGGTCDGDVLQYCQADGTLAETDCTLQHLVCGYFEEFADCVEDSEPPAPTNLCETIGSLGECNGNVVRYCVDGEVVSMDCGSAGCIYYDEEFGYGCG